MIWRNIFYSVRLNKLMAIKHEKQNKTIWVSYFAVYHVHETALEVKIIFGVENLIIRVE